jgi:hypothetical protein
MQAGAESVKRLVPAADLRYFDAGHFALDDHRDVLNRTDARLNI